MKYTLKKNIKYRNTGKEGLLYNCETDQMHILNETATEIMELLVDHSVLQVNELLTEKYGVAVEIIKNDVDEILADFVELGVLDKCIS